MIYYALFILPSYTEGFLYFEAYLYFLIAIAELKKNNFPAMNSEKLLEEKNISQSTLSQTLINFEKSWARRSLFGESSQSN